MPIENERKYLLNIDSLEEISNLSSKKINIKQGYLSKKARIRKKCYSYSSDVFYYFTYKKLIDNNLIEIETKISAKDFLVLWESINKKHKIEKIRYKIDEWEIDYFYDDKKVYLAMAEIELPENQEEPEIIPDFIKKYVIHSVAKHDIRFCNANLTLKKSKKLYKEFKNEQD
jgi:CYTH domain-containing protein